MNKTKTEKATMPPIVLCADHDDECKHVVDKVKCWLYKPELGQCPYLIDGASCEQA